MADWTKARVVTAGFADAQDAAVSFEVEIAG